MDFNFVFAKINGLAKLELERFEKLLAICKSESDFENMFQALNKYEANRTQVQENTDNETSARRNDKISSVSGKQTLENEKASDTKIAIKIEIDSDDDDVLIISNVKEEPTLSALVIDDNQYRLNFKPAKSPEINNNTEENYDKKLVKDENVILELLQPTSPTSSLENSNDLEFSLLFTPEKIENVEIQITEPATQQLTAENVVSSDQNCATEINDTIESPINKKRRISEISELDNEINTSSEDPTAKKPKMAEPPVDTRVKCNECHRSFSSVGYLKQHKNAVHAGKDHKCLICGKLFINASALESHMLKHNDSTKIRIEKVAAINTTATAQVQNNAQNNSLRPTVDHQPAYAFAVNYAPKGHFMPDPRMQDPRMNFPGGMGMHNMFPNQSYHVSVPPGYNQYYNNYPNPMMFPAVYTVIAPNDPQVQNQNIQSQNLPVQQQTIINNSGPSKDPIPSIENSNLDCKIESNIIKEEYRCEDRIQQTPSSKSPEAKKPLILVEQNDKLKIQCDECPKLFSSEKYLKQHFNAVHSGRNFKCDECHKKFESQEKLEDHQLKHDIHYKSFGCNLCLNRFVSMQSLKRHQISIHAPESGKYQCKYCLKFFPRVDHGERHELGCHKRHSIRPE